MIDNIIALVTAEKLSTPSLEEPGLHLSFRAPTQEEGKGSGEEGPGEEEDDEEEGSWEDEQEVVIEVLLTGLDYQRQFNEL